MTAVPQPGGAISLRFTAPLGPLPGAAIRLRFGAGAAPGARSVVARVGAPWRDNGAASAAPVRLAWQEPEGSSGRVAALWSNLAELQQTLQVPWVEGVGVQAVVAAVWGSPAAVGAVPVRATWLPTVPITAELQSPWRDAAPGAAVVAVRWRAGLYQRGQRRAAWRPALSRLARRAVRWRDGLAVVLGDRAPWGAGQPVTARGNPWVRVPPPPPEPGCWQPEPGGMVQLLFQRALAPQAGGSIRLRFACFVGRGLPALVVVPIRRVYFVNNNVTLQLLDGTPVHQLGLSMSLDVDSWCWRFSATLHSSALSLLNPDAGLSGVELVVGVNGQTWRMVAESIGRDRTFGRSDIRLQGRGRTALLAAPYATLDTFDNLAGPLTSQQLIDQALPSGWTCDYGQVPWLVPAGAWSHRGTPLTAAMAVASAAGGYLQPHAVNQVLRVLPRYPSAPWDWATAGPDIELPSAVTQREGIEWASKPVYNRVYVAGTGAGGKLVRVTRAGTAGDLAADTVTEALATHGDAGRQRGLAILADTGEQAMVSLSLQVLPETGVITPGKLVRYTDGGTVRLGLVRSVTVEAGFPRVRQIIGVETHVLS